MSKKTLLLTTLPAVCLAAFLAVVVGTRRSEPEPPPRAPVKRRATVPANAPAWVAEQSVVSPPPAPAEKVQRAMDDARMTSTYQNYRTAVATDNRAVMDALRPKLLQERATALGLAEAELASARTSVDRETAERTLRSLKD